MGILRSIEPQGRRGIRRCFCNHNGGDCTTSIDCRTVEKERPVSCCKLSVEREDWRIRKGKERARHPCLGSISSECSREQSLQRRLEELLLCSWGGRNIRLVVVRMNRTHTPSYLGKAIGAIGLLCWVGGRSRRRTPTTAVALPILQSQLSALYSMLSSNPPLRPCHTRLHIVVLLACSRTGFEPPLRQLLCRSTEHQVLRSQLLSVIYLFMFGR